MGLESATYISQLVATNPTSTDPKSQGDDHLRLIKSTLQNTFPNVTGAVTPTHTELNYVDGVTSPIQTQIDTKAAWAGQTYTGTHDFNGAIIYVPDQVYGTAGNYAANVDYVNQAAFQAVLPAQTGNANKFLSTDGTNASWDYVSGADLYLFNSGIV